MSPNGAMAMPQVPMPEGVVAPPPAEYERADSPASTIRPLGFPDSYAPMVGHRRTAGRSPRIPRRRSAWLTHCYASVGVGRDLAPDTGTGGELYAVIGHAPRPSTATSPMSAG